MIEKQLSEADEMEERLIQETRCLGNVTMNARAVRAENGVGSELQDQIRQSGVFKKHRSGARSLTLFRELA